MATTPDRPIGLLHATAMVVGIIIGAAIFVVLQDYVSSQTENWMSFIGLFFVLVVLFFPRGVLGMLRRKSVS